MSDTNLNRSAIFSDGTHNFITPMEPAMGDTVHITCRVGHDDVESVVLEINDSEKTMNCEKQSELFDIFGADIKIDSKRTTYRFRIKKGNETVYFNRRGVVDDVNTYFDFCLLADYKTPDWAKGAVMYQIFVDRFYNGDKSNDVVDNEYIYLDEPVNKVNDWNKTPATMGVREFYGGDLKGVWKKLDYLQDLGVEVLYLNPIFVSPSNHKYDTQDYDYIDPHYGVIIEDGGDALEPGDKENAHATKYIKRVVNRKNLEASNEFFAKFVEEVHRRGMKVILDGVFNHCGSFNKWMDREKIYDKDESYEKGAFLVEDSPYNSFFKFSDKCHWPDNTGYDSWWGNDTLPKLNYEDSPSLEEYILKVAKKWVSPPYNIDGWRLDVAADLGHSVEYNHHFWQKFRSVVKEANPNAIILAEHYGDPSGWLSGNEWDTVMNYDAFMEPVSWFLTGMQKHSDSFKSELLGSSNSFYASMTDYSARMTFPSLMVAMNELSNHDHSRFLTRTNKTVGRVASAGPIQASMGIDNAIMRQAVAIQMTWGGAPTIYYGDEAGVCGWTDPDNRRTYPWGNEDKDMIRFHKEMIDLHKNFPALKKGSLIYLLCEDSLIGYGRFDEEDQFFVLVQVEGQERDVDVEVWRLGVKDGQTMTAMMTSNREGFSRASDLRRVENGKVSVHMTPGSVVVWKRLKI